MRRALALLLLALFALGQEEKTVWDVWSDGQYAYLATGEGVRVLDGALQERGFLGGFPAYALAGEGEKLFAASDYGLYVLSLGDAPKVLARLKDFPARALAVVGGRAYLGGPAGFLVAEVGTGEPRVLGKLGGFSVWALAVMENRAFLATDRGLVIADVSSPEAPKVVGEASFGPAYALAVWEDLVYLGTAEGVLVLAEEAGTWKEVARVAGFRAYRLAVRDGVLYSAGIGGLRVYSLKDPRQPLPIASRQALVYTSLFFSPESLWVVSPAGAFVYALRLPDLPLMASSEQVPAVERVENPRFAQKFGAYASVVSGKISYLATRDGLKVMDLTDPKNPKLVAHVKGFVAYALQLVGDLLYVGCADGVRVFRVKGPGSLEQRVYLRDKAVYSLLFVRDVLYLGTAEGVAAVVWKGPALSVIWRREAGPIYSIGERQGYLYFGGASGLWALAIGQGAQGIRLVLKEPVFSLVWHQDFLYLGGGSGLRVYRYKAPAELVYVTGLPGFSAWYLNRVGNRLYVLAEAGLYLLDIAEPASPVVIVHRPGVLWTDFFLLGTYLYGLGPDGVYLIQVEDEASWVVTGLVLNYLAQVTAPATPPPPPPPPPSPAKGWYGTYWVKTWGATPVFFFVPETNATSVAVDPKGYVYVGGYTSGTLPGQVHQGGEDAFLARFDPSGKLLWLKQFGTSQADGIFAVTVDKVGNVYAAGHTLGSLGGASRGDWDFFVVKFTPEGKRIFAKQYGTPFWDKVTGLGVDRQGNLYVGGFTYGAFPGQRNAGDRDYFLAKLDGDGNLLWTRQGGSPGGDVTLGLAVGSDGFVYLVGTTDSVFPGQRGYGGEDVFLVKFDLRGNRVWARQYGTERDDRGQSVAVDATGIYVGGTTKGSFLNKGLGTKAFLLKLDGRGERLWVQEFGVGVVEGEGVITGSAYVAVAPGGQVYLADSATGNLPGYIGAGGADVFVLEYSSKGELRSVLQSGTDDDNLTYALALGPKGEVYVVGSTGSEAFLMKAKNPLPPYVPR